MAESALGVQEVSTTSGVGAYTLLGPTPDHWRFRDKIPSNTLLIYEAHDGARSEYGQGRFQFPDTLHRQNVINSSEGDRPIDWPVSGQCIISLIAEGAGVLPPGGECGQALIKYSHVDYEASWQWRPYPIAVWIDGAPGVNQKIRLAITEPIRFDPGFPQSRAFCDTAPAADYTINVNSISPGSVSSSLGTVVFAAGDRTGVWTTREGTEKVMQPGDRLEYHFQGAAGAIRNISLTARGVIVCGDEAASSFSLVELPAVFFTVPE